MNAQYDFPPEAGRLVYVRPVDVADLPDDVREMTGGLDRVYALHGADGARLALVRDRRLAFALARQHDLAAVNVH